MVPFPTTPNFRTERVVSADDSCSFVSGFVSGSSDSNLCRPKCCQFIKVLRVTNFLGQSSISVLGHLSILYPKSPLHNSKPQKERYLRAIFYRHTFPRVTLLVLLILLCLRNLMLIFSSIAGLDSSAGLVTCYGLDGPEFESRWRRDFPYPSRPPLGPTQSPIQWILVYFRGGGVKRHRRGFTHHHPHLAPRLKKEFLYSHTGLSWLGLEWTCIFRYCYLTYW